MALDSKPEAPKFAPRFKSPRKVKFADGSTIMSSWYEDPVFTSSGKVRATDDDVKRIQRKAERTE